MASIKHLITVQLTHSFVCLLNVFARLLPAPLRPAPPPPLPFGHSFAFLPSRVKIKGRHSERIPTL